MAADKDWRKKEPSLDEVIKKYPDIPPLFILKVDAQRRGVVLSEEAAKLADPEVYAIYKGSPAGLILRDGSYWVSAGYDFDPEKSERDPYIVDYIDGKFYLTDEGKKLEEVGFWEQPDFLKKKTSKGVPMSAYCGARPQRLDIKFINSYCQFWNNPKEGCKYCTFTANAHIRNADKNWIDVDEVSEVVHEALKQEGRFSVIMMTSGSILTGEELFDDELEAYIKLLQAIGRNFEPGKRFPTQVIATSFNKRQLERLYNETGVMTYTSDIEVLDEEKFNWICPGKAKYVGFQEWKKRLYDAVDVFGWGNVNSGCVLGVEQAQPYGFKTEDEAFIAVTRTAEELAEHGVSLAANVWRSSPHSIFQYQHTPSLDYFIRTYRAFDQYHHKYKLGKYIDDYRRCGNHTGLDLARI